MFNHFRKHKFIKWAQKRIKVFNDPETITYTIFLNHNYEVVFAKNGSYYLVTCWYKNAIVIRYGHDKIWDFNCTHLKEIVELLNDG